MAKDAKADFDNDVKLICERVNSWDDSRPVNPESVAELWAWQIGELLALVSGHVVLGCILGAVALVPFEREHCRVQDPDQSPFNKQPCRHTPLSRHYLNSIL
jgi:hypothetical protein